VIIARSDHPVELNLREKIAQFCDVEPRAVIAVTTSDCLYEVPLVLEAEGLEPT
jgi:CTP synthase